MKNIKKYIPITLIFTPFVALAVENIPGLINLFMNILDYTIALLIALALVTFLWGVIKYITAGGNEEKRGEARNTMIWGIVGLFVMVAVWGFVWLLLNTFDLETGSPPAPALSY